MGAAAPAPATAARELRADPDRTKGAGYYDQAAIGLRARDGDVTSCIATERLLAPAGSG